MASRAHYSTNNHTAQSSRSTPVPSAPPPVSRPSRIEPLKAVSGPHATLKSLKLNTAEGHISAIKTVAWNSTGSRVATGSADRSIRIWNPERLPDPKSRSRSVSSYTWELKGHTLPIEDISWDPTHSDRLASASQDKTVKLWEYRMLRQLGSIELGSQVLHVTYSPDGKFLATGTKDERICIISIESQQVIKEWQETSTSIHQIVWSHSGHLLCLSTQQGTVKIFETTTWKFLHEVEGNTSSVFCLQFDPQGRYLAVGGADAIVSLWDLNNWICVRVFATLTQPILSLSFSHDGMYLASASDDNLVDISEVETGQQVHTIPVSSKTNAVAWHPNKLILAIANDDKVLKLYQ